MEKALHLGSEAQRSQQAWKPDSLVVMSPVPNQQWLCLEHCGAGPGGAYVAWRYAHARPLWTDGPAFLAAIAIRIFEGEL